MSSLSIRQYRVIIEEIVNFQVKQEKTHKDDPVAVDSNNFTSIQPAQNKLVNDAKPTKQTKTETEKAVKNKENNNTKTKNKKSKEEKKEDSTELKTTEEIIKTEVCVTRALTYLLEFEHYS